MAVADSWEYTWRSGMIVGGTEDEEEAEPLSAPRFAVRLTLLVIVGVIAIGAVTTRVRLGVLRAEERRLLQEIADMKAVNELMRCQVAERSLPEVIATHAKEEGLQPPASIAEIGAPTVIEAGGGESGGVGAQMRQHSEETARNTAHRLRDILRGPGKGP